MTTDQGAREALVERFPLDEYPLEAEALRQVEGQWEGYPTADYPSYLLGASRALLALRPLAAAEVAAAVSEAQAEGERLGFAYEMEHKGALIYRDRAESAEAEVERLRGGIRALADEWERRPNHLAASWPRAARELLDLLSPSPAATTGGHDDRADGPSCEEPEIDPGDSCYDCGLTSHVITPSATDQPSATSRNRDSDESHGAATQPYDPHEFNPSTTDASVCRCGEADWRHL